MDATQKAAAAPEAMSVPAERRAAPRPVTPGWVDRLIRWVDRLPGRWWAWYAAAAVVGVLGANGTLWLAGSQESGTFSVTQTYYGVLPVVLILTLRYLDGAARRAATTFRPALDVDDASFSALVDELTLLPARPTLVLTLAVAAFTVLDLVGDPVASRVEGMAPAPLAARVVSEALVSVLFVLLAYHTVRQLRAVTRVHALAVRIDLFRPVPIHGFSGLTMRTALVIAGLLLSSVAADPGGWELASAYIWVGWFGGGLVIAFLAFTLPLRGMHDRIVVEKHRLQDANGTRLSAVTADLHAVVDSGDLGRVDGLNKALASLVAERDLLAKLPTWPWQPGQAWAVGSATLLPIAIFLLTRVLGQQLHV
ncbi:MAG: hypothetical protein U0869_04500 [Chloroflexota bacterium]